MFFIKFNIEFLATLVNFPAILIKLRLLLLEFGHGLLDVEGLFLVLLQTIEFAIFQVIHDQRKKTF